MGTRICTYFEDPIFKCQWVKVTGGGVTVDNEYGLTIADLSNIGYKYEPFVVAKDVNPVFYVNDMSTKLKRGKNDNDSIKEPKRHIVLSGKRVIVGIEDKLDMLDDYEKDDRIPPFKVNKDTPWLRCDHNLETYVKKKFTVVPT
jgi:hypothetical protein